MDIKNKQKQSKTLKIKDMKNEKELSDKEFHEEIARLEEENTTLHKQIEKNDGIAHQLRLDFEKRKMLFDDTGRRISGSLNTLDNVAVPESFIEKPSLIDYWNRFARGFGETGLSTEMSVPDFKVKAADLISQLEYDPRTKNLLNGPALPIILPKTEVDDLGTTTEVFITAVGKSYCKEFTKRKFKNNHVGRLSKNICVAAKSRYEKLLEAVRKESIVGVYFPNAFLGFSVAAQRKLMDSLPEGFCLSGPIDMCMAFAMYPDVLCKNGNTPNYVCSAIDVYRYLIPYFWLTNRSFNYGFQNSFCSASSYTSGGLVFLGNQA